MTTTAWVFLGIVWSTILVTIAVSMKAILKDSK